jgi:hypothetical protein
MSFPRLLRLLKWALLLDKMKHLIATGHISSDGGDSLIFPLLTRMRKNTYATALLVLWLSGKLLLALVILAFGPRGNHDPYYSSLTTAEKEKYCCVFVVTRMCLLRRCLATSVSSGATIPAYYGRRTDTQLHKQYGDLTALLLFFQNK